MLLTDLPERLAVRISVDVNGCWLWTGNRSRSYGYIYNGGGRGNERRTMAHRAVYEAAVGPVPDGLELDHLCRVRLCVNPAHLEPVTRLENIRRGVGPAILGALNGSKTECKNGHPFDEANTRLRPTGGRTCRQCERDRRARRAA